MAAIGSAIPASSSPPYAEGLALAGWSVAMPGYTLAPQASLTTIVEEIGAALDWLADHGPAHGVAGPVVLAGWSAGAQLAVLHLGHRLVAAGLAISGIYDLGPLRDTALNDALKLSDEEIATLSPLRLPPTPKPLAIAYGTRELPALVHDSRELHALALRSSCAGPSAADCRRGSFHHSRRAAPPGAARSSARRNA